MKTKTQHLIGAFSFIALVTIQASLCIASEERLSKALFSMEEVKDQRYDLVGRLSLRRQFLGTRATPAYKDYVDFHFFDGSQLKFSTFDFSTIGTRISQQLLSGQELPALMGVRFDKRQVGHDGINRSIRFVPNIESCDLIDVDSICKAAGTKGFSEQAQQQFKSSLPPGFTKGDVAVSVGKMTARSKVTPRGSAISIQAIKVYNSSAKAAKIEILSVTVQQGNSQQKASQSKRSSAPMSWEVPANSWADGQYEAGKMPRKLWLFDIKKPVKAEKPVTLLVKLKLNDGDAFTIQKTVIPN